MNIAAQLFELKLATTKDDKKAIVEKYQSSDDFLLTLKDRFDVNLDIRLSAKQLTDKTPFHGAISLAQLQPALAIDTPLDTQQRKQMAHQFLSQFDGEQYDLMVQLLTKQLALGIGVHTVNQVLPKLVPEFSVQLAYPFAKKIGAYKDTDKFYVTQKLDGHRNITVVKFADNGQPDIMFYSRTGQVRLGMAQLRTQVQHLIAKNNTWFKRLFADGFILDGEVIAHPKADETTVQRFQRTSDTLDLDGEKTGLDYNVFDMVSLPEFKGLTKTKPTYQFRRTNWLELLHANEAHDGGDSDLNILPVLAVIDKSQIAKWSDYATQQGWEGVMLNYANGVYKTKRSNQLLKVKKMHTADLPIIGFNIDGDYLQTMNVKLNDTDVVSVGSGLTDEIRSQIMADPDNYIGVMIEVQYFEKMKANAGETLRFPVFKAFRYDKTPDDINIE